MKLLSGQVRYIRPKKAPFHFSRRITPNTAPAGLAGQRQQEGAPRLQVQNLEDNASLQPSAKIREEMMVASWVSMNKLMNHLVERHFSTETALNSIQKQLSSSCEENEEVDIPVESEITEG